MYSATRVPARETADIPLRIIAGRRARWGHSADEPGNRGNSDMTHFTSRTRFAATASPIAIALAMLSSPASAQDDAVANPVAGTEEGETATGDSPAPGPAADDTGSIVVTGYRAALRNATNTKKRQDQIVEAVNSEDIG